MKKISGVYKIENTITGDCYVGSSKDVNMRWIEYPTIEAKKYLEVE